MPRRTKDSGFPLPSPRRKGDCRTPAADKHVKRRADTIQNPRWIVFPSMKHARPQKTNGNATLPSTPADDPLARQMERFQVERNAARQDGDQLREKRGSTCASDRRREPTTERPTQTSAFCLKTSESSEDGVEKPVRIGRVEKRIVQASLFQKWIACQRNTARSRQGRTTRHRRQNAKDQRLFPGKRRHTLRNVTRRVETSLSSLSLIIFSVTYQGNIKTNGEYARVDKAVAKPSAVNRIGSPIKRLATQDRRQKRRKR